MKKDKNKTMAIVLAVITIVVVVLTFVFEGDNKGKEEVKIVTNPSEFFTVNSCLYRMTTYILKNDTGSLLQILDNGYKKKNKINKKNVLNAYPKLDQESTFISKKMYYEKINSNITKYYVYGIIEENVIHDYTNVVNSEKQKIYFIVILDSKRQIFSVRPYDGDLFMDGEKND